MTFYISNSIRITSVLHIQIFLCCWWWSEGWGSSYVFVKVTMQPLINFHPLSLPPFFSYSSSVTQQLFLVVNGILSSAYCDKLCPKPILKWLFQVSLCYSCSYHNSACVTFFWKPVEEVCEYVPLTTFKSDIIFSPWVLICSPIWNTLSLGIKQLRAFSPHSEWMQSCMSIFIYAAALKKDTVSEERCYGPNHVQMLILLPFTLRKTMHAAVCKSAKVPFSTYIII